MNLILDDGGGCALSDFGLITISTLEEQKGSIPYNIKQNIDHMKY